MTSEICSSLPNWLDLPRDVTIMIFQRLDTRMIFEVAKKVCVTWHNICKDPCIIRGSIRMISYSRSELEQVIKRSFYLDRMCRHAIKLNFGGLNEVELHGFATDELLHYIASRAPELKVLKLVYCRHISEEGLSKMAQKLPKLEELHLIHHLEPSKEVFESFGYSCPQLKSLAYDCIFNYNHIVDRRNNVALAVAQTMPGLRRLSLLGNQMTNHGLRAILDGCPHLEFLDLRWCNWTNLNEDFGNAYACRIKNLKFDLRNPDTHMIRTLLKGKSLLDTRF